MGALDTLQVQFTVVWGWLDQMVLAALPAGPTMTMLLSGRTTAQWPLGLKFGLKLTRSLMYMAAAGAQFGLKLTRSLMYMAAAGGTGGEAAKEDIMWLELRVLCSRKLLQRRPFALVLACLELVHLQGM